MVAAWAFALRVGTEGPFEVLTMEGAGVEVGVAAFALAPPNAMCRPWCGSAFACDPHRLDPAPKFNQA